jgi:hypothetical protein
MELIHAFRCLIGHDLRSYKLLAEGCTRLDSRRLLINDGDSV